MFELMQDIIYDPLCFLLCSFGVIFLTQTRCLDEAVLFVMEDRIGNADRLYPLLSVS